MNFLKWIFGGGRNVIAETAGVFVENTEAGAQRRADYAQAALSQFGTEFKAERKGRFDRFMDGLNRLPRPFMVLTIFALFAMAMIDPLWFAERMQGLALVPDPLWWFAGTVVGFYFGGRYQVKAQQFRQSLAETTAQVPKVLERIKEIRALRHDSPGAASTGSDSELEQATTETSANKAVTDWEESQEWP